MGGLGRKFGLEKGGLGMFSLDWVLFVLGNNKNKDPFGFI